MLELFIKKCIYYYYKFLFKFYRRFFCVMDKIKIFLVKVNENKGKIAIGIIVFFLIFIAFKIGSCF